MRKIERENIIKGALRHLKKFICAMNAEKEHVLITLKEQLEKQVGYYEKLEAKFKQIPESLNRGVTVEEFIIQRNLDLLGERYRQAKFLVSMIPNNMVVSIISVFDYFIYELLHTILENDQNIFDSMNKKIDYNDISSFKSVDEIRQYYIASIVEQELSKSHDMLFLDLENSFNVRGLKKMAHYKDLLFITEIRHIIVHHDAKIGVRFKKSMLDLKIDYEKYGFFAEDGILDLMPDHIMWIIETVISSGLHIFFEICERYGDKDKDMRGKYMLELNRLCLDYISIGSTKIALAICDDFLSKKLSPEEIMLYTINKAVALNAEKESEKVITLLNRLEWTNADCKFILAKNILLKEYEEAVKYMDCVDLLEWDCGYQDWPLCKEFVTQEIFKEKYRSLYGHEFEKKISRGYLTVAELRKIREDRKKRLRSYESNDKKEN